MFVVSKMKYLFNMRYFLYEFTKKDLQQKYLGSYLGIAWAFIQPFFTVLIFWFVFLVGFKAMPIDNYPFILWLLCGMFPWFFFSETICATTNAIVENSYLVQKVVFDIKLLLLTKILSLFFVHVVFVSLLFIIFAFYGYLPVIYNLQVLYYMFATVILVTAISFITSSLTVFFRDIGQFTSMLVQFAFWGTPVFWNINMIPMAYQWVIKLNPAYYIIEGYRNCFIYKHWFWETPIEALYFWGVTVALFVIGSSIFKKLKVHFADVL